MAYLDENGLEHFWGKIKDHVDSAVAPKADDADVVHRSGDEIITGEKIFADSRTSASGNKNNIITLKDEGLTRGTVPSATHYSGIGIIDSQGSSYSADGGSRLAALAYKAPSSGDPSARTFLQTYNFDGSESINLEVGYDADGRTYATAPATSDDRTASTDIVTRGYMEVSEWNWQKTKKNVLVQFKSVPESDLEPIVDFAFMETSPAEGEKSPSNPSTITGVSSVGVGRCGKNLVKINHTSFGIFTVNTDGSLIANGTITSGVVFQFRFPYNKPLPPGKYTLSFNNNIANSNVRCSLRRSDANWGSGSDIGRDGYLTSVNMVRAVEIKENSTNTMFYLNIPAGTYENFTIKMQLESGTVATEYEPPVRDEYTIAFGDIYYGGSLDVATGVMVVDYQGLVFDGTENWVPHHSIAGCYQLQLIKQSTGAGNTIFCTHYDVKTSLNTVGFYVSINYCYFYTEYATATDLKSFLATQSLAGTPVVVVYKLLSPFTVQLTPTQIKSLPVLDKYEPRVNTVYTDQEAVQVGYQRYVGEDNLVHKTGDEDISGWKKFNGPVRISGGFQIYGATPYYHIINSTLTQSATPNSSQYSGYVFTDKDMKAYNKTQVWVATDGSSGWACLCNAFDHMGDSSFDAAYALYLDRTASSSTAAVSKVIAFRPDQSNSITLGTSNNRWKEVWTNASAINSSDERIKTFIESVPDDVLDAWGEVDFCQFKFNDAVVEKGADKARIHDGLIAQRIDSVFKHHNLDISRYGLFCYDEWDSESEIKDNEGNIIREFSEAGNLYSIRYAEALCMEAAYMRRENARLKKRMADLEERLAALELKIS